MFPSIMQAIVGVGCRVVLEKIDAMVQTKSDVASPAMQRSVAISSYGREHRGAGAESVEAPVRDEDGADAESAEASPHGTRILQLH